MDANGNRGRLRGLRPGECMRCGEPALREMVCNACGRTSFSDEDCVLVYDKDKGWLEIGESGDQQKKLQCKSCESEKFDVIYQKYCISCKHIMSLEND